MDLVAFLIHFGSLEMAEMMLIRTNMGIDAHGDTVHAKMAGGTQRDVSIGPIELEPPDSPTGCSRRHADQLDGLESHENTLNMHRHAHGNAVDSSNTPENASVIPDLPARGAVSHMNEPEGPQGQTDSSNTCTYAQSTANDLRTPANASKNVNSPGRSAETCRGAREAWKPLGCIGHAHVPVQ